MLPLVLAEVTSGLEVAMIFAALKTLLEIYRDPVLIGWLVTGFLLVAAASAAICGRLGDLYGRRRILLIVLAFTIAGSLLSAFADDIRWIIAGRCVQGLSGAILPLCYGLAREHLPAEKVPLGVSIITGTAAVSGAGLLIGGVIIDNAGWHHIFTASAAVALVSFVAIFVGLPKSRTVPVTGRLDLLGGILFPLGIVLLLMAVGEGRDRGFGDERVLAMAGAAIAILVFWLWHELRHPNPMISVRLLANRNVAVAHLCMILVAGAAMQTVQVFPLLMQQPVWTGAGLGLAATLVGVLKLPESLLAFFGSLWSGFATQRQGPWVPMLVGGTVAGLSWLSLALLPINVWTVIGVGMLMALGTSTLYATLPNIVVTSVPAERVSEAAGFLSVTRTTFKAVGAQLTSVLLSLSMVSDPSKGPGAFPSAVTYDIVFVVIGCLSLAAAMLGLAVRARAPSTERPQDAVSPVAA
jgi:MFS family permease